MSINTYRYWDIIAVDFPFSDVSGKIKSKIRPWLVIKQDRDDCLITMLGSNIENAQTTDFIVNPDEYNRLKVRSFMRVVKLNFVNRKMMYAKIGNLSTKDKELVKEKFISFFQNL